MTIKDFYNQNKRHIAPALGLAKLCLQNVIEMREKPRLVDYASLALSFKDNFENAYNLRDPYSYFCNPDWKFLASDNLGTIICRLIRECQSSRIVPVAVSDSVSAFVGEIHGVRFGWVMYDDEAEKVYVESGKLKGCYEALGQAFWERYPSGYVVIGMGDDDKFYVKDDDTGTEFLVCKSSFIWSDWIKKFLDKGFGRSLLFYGPPGSGKSNLVRSIAAKLACKTIRINNVVQFSGDTIATMLEVFSPDAVILEDIDNIPDEEIDSLLHKMERFNKPRRILMATANQVTKLDNAMVRPGRFDRPVQISKLDGEIVMKLVEGDAELFEIVKDFPAAYTAELLKRVKSLGREEALADISDITDRIDNFSSANYDLKAKDVKSHDFDD